MVSTSGEQDIIIELLKNALKEDVGDGDHTSLATIQADAQGSASVRFKQDGVLSGLEVAITLLQLVDPKIRSKSLAKEGDQIVSGTVVMQLEGNIQSLLKAERILLNCMQRMSGIATITRKFVNEVAGTKARILDTRKTTPNFRVLEKKAVKDGGGWNHRFGLYDMILVKDNHVDACGGVKNAVNLVNAYLKKLGKNLPVEIEIRNTSELAELLSIGSVNRILLDNFQPEKLREAVRMIDGKFETEASGGIQLTNIRSYAECGVDFISVGALTHSYYSLDISMKLTQPDG